MPVDQSTILTSELVSDNSAAPPAGGPKTPRLPLKKILLIFVLAAAIIILVVGIFFAVKKYWLAVKQPAPVDTGPISATTTVAVATTSATLPSFDQPENIASDTAASSFSDLAIEYLSFADFYEAPDNKITPKITDYKLPLNVKIDVMNYYDVSRKLNLDPGLDNLNKDGLVTIDNPWAKEAPDFFALYGNLNSKQIPLLITSDFIIYYYQNILKKTFKDIEENVFYHNLWEINKELYTAAKDRYEARLAAIGNINDSILEGERLETAFFAVALELLKPAVGQIAPQGALTNKGQFTVLEANQFYFITPPYLRDDVLAEVKLIREANKNKIKSPVLLYTRDYTNFAVPIDYRFNAKLNNFYLTTKWLNSVFPLNYHDKDCLDCLLDQADWRINLTAASLIAKDFSSLPDLKNKWARIYKIISFFKGLREDLNYVHYRDSLIALFGPDYKIEELFDDQNKEAGGNLEKLRAKLLTYNFPAISGALSKTDKTLKSQLGFKMLAESYWPNDYIFSRLTTPAVDTYIGTSTKPNNITACQFNKANRRCNGFALDVIGLIWPISNNVYFDENTNYLNYEREAARLREELNKNQESNKNAIWHSTNYWTTLSLIKAYLEMDKNNLPLFTRSANWQDKSLRTAVGVWINLQLPLENLVVNQPTDAQSLDSFSRWSENSYVEPNLNLLNELLANNTMLLKMFTALQLDKEVSSTLLEIENFSSRLSSLKKIVIKELSGESLEAADNETIADFTKQFKVESAVPQEKQLSLKSPSQKTALKEDLSRLKLLVLTHQEGDNKVFSVGPVWDYQEGR